MPPSSPQLPADFVDNILKQPFMKNFESMSQTPEFEETRFAMTDGRGRDLRKADDIVTVDSTSRTASQWTHLHIAAMIGDPILVCEMIRLGATVDMVDASGKTPLFLAVESMWKYNHTGVDPFVTQVGNSPEGRSMNRTHTGLLRFHYGVRILLEQHADPKCASKGVTPLHIACKLQFWDLIELLLKYGADPVPSPLPGFTTPAPPTAFLRTSADKTRFRALVGSTAGSPRPPRLCPCFSGNTLAACHGAEDQPFPLDFLGRCGSRKAYRKCCSKRKFATLEKWDEAGQWIVPCEIRPVLLPVSEEQNRRIRENLNIMADVSEVLGLPPENFRPPSEYAKWGQQYTDQLLLRGLMDPAFAYAIKRLNFIPRPRGRTHSKRDMANVQMRWNAVIDEYILACSDDKRSKDEIERAAKIGISNGALYRHCEGKGCDKMEGRDIVMLSKCTQCKIAIYCSRLCQSSDWKTHKSLCGKPGQLEQALPSQQAVDKYIVAESVEALSKLKLTPPPRIKAALDELRASKRRTE